MSWIFIWNLNNASLKLYFSNVVDDEKSPKTFLKSHARAVLAGLHAPSLAVIEQVIHQYSDWSARKISDYSHKDMPWKAAQEGQIIDYELAFYREAPFSARQYDEPAMQ